MSKSIPGNNKHLTLSDRILLEKCLNEDMSFKEIARYMDKDPTTVSREVKRRYTVTKSANYRVINHCDLKQSCQEKGICSGNECNIKRCKNCNRCNSCCPKFVPDSCYKRLHRAPYVCNGCTRKVGCHQAKRYYRAVDAEKSYRSTLTDCRKGINLTLDELNKIDEIVSPSLKKGQPLYHIYENNIEDIPCTIRTLYNLVNQGAISSGRMDLRRAVRCKPRKKKSDKEDKIMRKHRIGRTKEDLSVYLTENIELAPRIVQMDTVVGGRGSTHSLLTFYFVRGNLQLAFLLEEHTSQAVCEVFDYLELLLTPEIFRELFPIIVTDNGTEFSDSDYLERAADGSKRTRIFYCDPYSSWQKGGCEKNHEFIRYVIPKGTSMDNIYQKHVNKMMSHINSTCRESLGGKCPYDIALTYMCAETLKSLGIKKIPPSEVNLTPSLLK
ncbi:MAG: IS30 family transposase [Eubacterium sp.]|nr:IS30 family transposase [Eubacterium sp.]